MQGALRENHAVLIVVYNGYPGPNLVQQKFGDTHIRGALRIKTTVRRGTRDDAREQPAYPRERGGSLRWVWVLSESPAGTTAMEPNCTGFDDPQQCGYLAQDGTRIMADELSLESTHIMGKLSCDRAGYYMHISFCWCVFL
eukprot:COSAG02_NODE_21037_length_805_cov_1.235127_1_plen_140_part_01